jgi:hypothetical protein
MLRRLVLLTVVFCGGALVLCHGRNALAEPAPAKEKGSSPAAPLVQQALDNEVAGDGEGRRAHLEQAIAADPAYPPAHWHLGHLRTADAWLPAAEAMTIAADSELMAQYQAKRDEAAANAALELKLAQWCVKNDMPDRARLHFWRVLTNPKASESQAKDAAGQLDLVTLGGMILTRQELKQEQEREKRIGDAIEKYRPVLARLQPVIDGGFDAKHETAVAKLKSIDDPAVIPAIESYLSEHREGFGEELVKVLAQFQHYEATQTLARFAVVSPYLSVRERAIGELKKRPLHDYMPLLLAGLTAPIQSQFNFRVDRRGTIAYQHAFLREEPGFNLVAYQNTLFRPGVADTVQYTDKPRADLPKGSLQVDAMVVSPQLIMMELGMLIERQELAANARNLASAEQNKRVFAALEQTTDTGQPPPRNPKDWWQWWQDYNQVHYRKPTYTQYATSQRYYYKSYVAGFLTTNPSCFIAGTPVWTESGMKPIESIQPGDRVLSQDPDTGELTFKVVIGTTLRPPTEASKLTVNGEAITTTLGHPLWVTGKGWEMAKHVKEGDQLHGIGGIVNVNSIEPLPNKVEAHNLVVDDSNTYFVGNCGMLVHDNTYRKPTRAIVPGLVPDLR